MVENVTGGYAPSTEQLTASLTAHIECVAVDVIVGQKSSLSLQLPACSLLAAAAFASAMQLSRERCFYRRR